MILVEQKPWGGWKDTVFYIQYTNTLFIKAAGFLFGLKS